MNINDVIQGIYAWHGRKWGAVKALAEATGIPAPNLYDFVNNKSNISAKTLFKILEVIGVEPEIYNLSTDAITDAMVSENAEQELRDLGFSLEQIGKITGVTRQRVHQMTNP